MNVADLSLARIVAQRLVGPTLAEPADVVGHLLAMQAQSLPGVLESVALRAGSRADRPGTPPPALPAVEATVNAGALVRSWPMRHTLHLMRTGELPRLLALTRDRIEAASRTRRAQLELDESMYADAFARLRPHLATRALSRAEIIDLLPEVNEVSGRAYHLITLLALRGVLVAGPLQPDRPGEQLFADAQTWGGASEPPGERAAAVTWLVERYFTGHGPATLDDLVRWCGLTKTELRRGIAAAGERIAQLEIGGVEYWMDPALPDLLAAHREEASGLFFLPAFDEMILGYADRSVTLDPADELKVVPGKNGVFRPVVVFEGRALATWSRDKRGRLAIDPFRPLRGAAKQAIEAAVADSP